MQWDDELFSRESQCELFDLIGSEDKLTKEAALGAAKFEVGGLG